MIEAAIPYITVSEIQLGSFTLPLFGLLAALGVLAGRWRAFAFIQRKDIDRVLFRSYALWVLGTAFLLSHWVSIFFYFPEKLSRDPWILLKLFDGMSSVGGFLGALVGGVAFLRLWCARRPVGAQPVPIYADVSTYGLLVGWCFGRAACSIAHDHPGRVVPEGTFMAVGPWPDGLWRYDLGLLELVFVVVLTLLVYFVLRWEHWAPGRLTGLVLTAYAPYRFLIDSLRTAEPVPGVLRIPDERYLGLTPAQWFTVGFLLLGLWLLFVRKPSEADQRYATESDRLRREAEAEG